MRWLALAALVACAPDDAPISFEAEIAPLFWAECGDCHRGAQPDGDLDLWEAPYDALVGVPSTQSALAIVEPGDALYSYLWHKLNGTQSIAGGSGTAMPLDGLLAQPDLDRVTLWIDQGAHP